MKSKCINKRNIYFHINTIKFILNKYYTTMHLIISSILVFLNFSCKMLKSENVTDNHKLVHRLN